MRKEFEGKITVYRILDSRREKFNLSKAYEDKVDVKNVITAPEIEKLIICNEGKIKEYERELRKNNKNLKFVSGNSRVSQRYEAK